MRKRKNYKQPTRELKTKAVSAYQNGLGAASVADAFGYDRVTIHRWAREIETNPNLARKVGSGRSPKIDDKNARRLLKIIKQPASSYGYETDLWNSSRIRQICKKELKLEVSRMAVWRVLNKFYGAQINSPPSAQLKWTIRSHPD